MPDIFDSLGIPSDATGATDVTPQAPLGPTDLGLPAAFANVLGPSPQLPPAPAMPSLPPNIAQDPKQKLAMLATLGFMLGAGQRSGLAQGAAHGELSGLQNTQQLANQRYAAQQREAQQQQALLVQQQAKAAADERQRQQNLMTALGQIKKRVETVQTKAQYDQEIDGYASMLQSAGYRLDANWLRQAAPYVAPKASDLAGKAVKGFLTNPANKQLLEQHPEELAKVMLTFDRDGDGVAEQVPLTLAAQIAGTPFAMDQNGQVMTYPKGTSLDDKANADGMFNDLLAKAKAEGKDPTDPQLRMDLRQQALKLAKEASVPADDGMAPTPDDVRSAATAILQGKMSPSQFSTLYGGFGKQAQSFKRAVTSQIRKIDPSFSFEEAEANYQFGKSTGVQTTVRYIDNIAKTIPMLRAANQAFKRGNVRVINDVIRSGKSQFGSVDVADFDFKRTLLADEIAKVLQGGGTGNGTSDAKLKQAADLLAGDMTPAQFETVLNAAEEMLTVRRKSLTDRTFIKPPADQTPGRFEIIEKGK